MPRRFEGQCRECGGYGHRQADCANLRVAIGLDNESVHRQPPAYGGRQQQDPFAGFGGSAPQQQPQQPQRDPFAGFGGFASQQKPQQPQKDPFAGFGGGFANQQQPQQPRKDPFAGFGGFTTQQEPQQQHHGQNGPGIFPGLSMVTGTSGDGVQLAVLRHANRRTAGEGLDAFKEATGVKDPTCVYMGDEATCDFPAVLKAGRQLSALLKARAESRMRLQDPKSNRSLEIGTISILRRPGRNGPAHPRGQAGPGVLMGARDAPTGQTVKREQADQGPSMLEPRKQARLTGANAVSLGRIRQLGEEAAASPSGDRGDSPRASQDLGAATMQFSSRRRVLSPGYGSQREKASGVPREGEKPSTIWSRGPPDYVPLKRESSDDDES